MNNKYVLCVKIFLFLLLLQITVFSQPNTAELTYLAKHSDVILTGRVIHQKSHWNYNQSRIYTIATLEVEEYIKGNNLSKNLKVDYPGGEIDNIGELYTHTARLEDEELVLLFVKKSDETSNYKIMEGELGKVPLQIDRLSGEKITSNNKKLSAYKKEINKIITQD